MQNNWFISDTHFGHENIMRHSQRPFSSIEEMNEVLIENWNNNIGSKDNVYFLGDFAFRNKEAAISIRNRLNGYIFFIEGNHDASVYQIRHKFVWYKQLHKVNFYNDIEIVLCHYALKVWQKSHYGVLHCYGHSHGSLPDDIHSLSIDVGIDATAMRLSNLQLGKVPIILGSTKQKDYRPIHLDEILQFMKNKTFIPVDHHKNDRN